MSMTRPGLAESQQTQAMIDRIALMRPGSMADALRELRKAFPDIPLTARVTALEALSRTSAAP